MHIEPIGQGRPLILLHGWAMHGGIFAGLVEQLAPRFRCYVIDLPGHGYSNKVPLAPALLVNALKQLLIDLPRPMACLGWSLGGAIATELALQAPELVNKLITIASSPCFVQRPDWPHGMPSATFAKFATDLAQDWRQVVQRFLALEALGSSQEQSELRWLQNMVFARGEPDPEALQHGLTMLNQIDLRARLRQLSCASLFIGGKRDRLVPPSALHAAATQAGAEVNIMERAGHAPFLAHAAELAQVIDDFVN